MAKPEPSILDDVDEAAERAAEAEADADVEAGRVVDHARVREWLKTVGTPEQAPTPFASRR